MNRFIVQHDWVARESLVVDTASARVAHFTLGSAALAPIAARCELDPSYFDLFVSRQLDGVAQARRQLTGGSV